MEEISCGEGLLSQMTSNNVYNYEPLTVESLTNFVNSVFNSSSINNTDNITITSTAAPVDYIHYDVNIGFHHPSYNLILSHPEVSEKCYKEPESVEYTFEDILLIENEQNIINEDTRYNNS